MRPNRSRNSASIRERFVPRSILELGIVGRIWETSAHKLNLLRFGFPPLAFYMLYSFKIDEVCLF